MENQRGFTLIELLVVMMVIGILAAIALPAFLGQTNKGQDSVAKSDLNTAVKALQEHALASGTYDTDAATLQAAQPALADAVALAVSGDDTTFAVSVDSASGTTFAVRRSGGATVRDCSDPGAGGCATAPDAAGNYW